MSLKTADQVIVMIKGKRLVAVYFLMDFFYAFPILQLLQQIIAVTQGVFLYRRENGIT